MVVGLYCVLWGKSRERKDISSNVDVAKGKNSDADFAKDNSSNSELA